MGKITGFKEYKRRVEAYRPIKQRVGDYAEITTGKHNNAKLIEQGARCMDCGVPFCQSENGCPIDNLIPEWNDLVYHNDWHAAFLRLMKTNNFPEFTGRVCPAPCESACVLGITDPAVSIKNIEVAIIDYAFEQGWVKPRPPISRSGKSVAIVGSGPAGLAAADELNKLGHKVVVFERDDHIGGLLMYGIPNMKLDKATVKRRVDLLKAEGIEFVVNANIGKNVSFEELRKDFDAILLATGATKARVLDIKGADSKGVHLAMEYLTTSIKAVLDGDGSKSVINACDKNVIIIGGGDTGTDCIATAVRQGAKSIVNFELVNKHPVKRSDDNPWPEWPLIYRLDYGHEEVKVVYGDDPRHYCLMTKEFISDDKGYVSAVKTAQINTEDNFAEIANSEQIWQADLVLLAMGFVSPEHYISDQGSIELDDRGNYLANDRDYQTNQSAIFSAGDCRRGQSLIVWAIAEGRCAASAIDNFLNKMKAIPL